MSRRWIGLFLLLAFALTFRLGTRTLWEPDEGRYAEIAREMKESGDWLTPRFNHVTYLEKPPLLYWATAGSFRLLGREDGWSARLPLALTTLLTCLLVALSARKRLGDGAAFWATVAYGSCLYVFLHSHVLITDGLLTLGIAAAFAGLELERSWLWGAGLGLGVLAKGPIAVVLPCLGLGMECLFERSLAPVRSIRGLLRATLIALGVALPWFVLEQRAVPDFLDFFINHEHLKRFATAEAKRPGPPWMFVALAAVGWCPWWGALWTGLRHGWKEPAVRRGIAWASATVLFFSVSKSKLPPYVWPAFPCLALAVGFGVPRTSKRAWTASCAALLVLGLAALAASSPLLAAKVYRNFSAAAPAGLVLGGIWTVLALLSFKGGRGVLAGGFLLSLMALVWGAERLDEAKSSKALAERILADDPEGKGVIANHRGFRPSLPFYTKRRILLWGRPDELTYGMRTSEPGWFFDTTSSKELANAQMRTRWQGGRKVYAVVRRTDVAWVFALLGPPCRILAEIGEDAVLVNRGPSIPFPPGT